MSFPDRIQINAFTGAATAPHSPFVPKAGEKFALGVVPVNERLDRAVPGDAKPEDWSDARVGWTLLLPIVSGWTNAQLAAPSDQPACIQALWEARGRPDILRFNPASDEWMTKILKPAQNTSVALSRAGEGTAKQQLPAYILIVGGPGVVPWDVQYILNESRSVGRLALEGDALERYVSHLLDGWKASTPDPRSPVVWSVDHGGDDISRLMRNSLGKPIAALYASDPDLTGAAFVDGGTGSATEADLVAALARRPAMIVTTSHGATTPLDDLDALSQQLGWLVDGNRRPIDPTHLLANWQPDGAIWYAHACCSAGSQDVSHFDGLFAKDSEVGEVLDGLTRLGPRVAPMPQDLLGAVKPARAFIGHVEPTFNFTLRHPVTKQFLSESLYRSLYNGIFKGRPVGLAMRDHFRSVAGLAGEHDALRTRYRRSSAGAPEMLYQQLAMRDIRSTVILGDPTARLSIPWESSGWDPGSRTTSGRDHEASPGA